LRAKGYKRSWLNPDTDDYACALATGISLHGVESVEYSLSNSGCGYHWTETIPKYTYHSFAGRSVEYEEVEHSEHNFSTSFEIEPYPSWLVGGSGKLYPIKKSYDGNQDYIKETVTFKNMWSYSKMIGYSTTAKLNNQSTARVGPIKLNLKPITIETAQGIFPIFFHRYKLENGLLKSVGTFQSFQPEIAIKSVYSNVNNNQNFEGLNAKTTTVYRSDKVELNPLYDELGRYYTIYTYDLQVGDSIYSLHGTTISLDEDFFMLYERNRMDDKTIIRPYSYIKKSAKVTIQVDTHNGYIPGLGEGVKQKTFNLEAGDVISLTAVNYSSSVTPSWSSNYSDAITYTDDTGANMSIDYRVQPGDNIIRLDVVNPTLIVQANPNVYVHRVSRVTYKVENFLTNITGDWDTYYPDNIEQLHTRIKEVYSDMSKSPSYNPKIRMEFSYEFDNNYPDPDNIQKNLFGTPQEAVLTVYKSDGSVRERYSSVKKPGSPTNYEVDAKNGTYTFSGRLRDLGWEDGDFATVIIYGSNIVDDQRASTRETIIDFLTTSGGYVTVNKPDGSVVAGSIYDPIVIEKAKPTENYDITAWLAPGFVAKWKDYSGDLDGDGQVSEDEYFKFANKMAAYGMDLDTIYSSNVSYRELFWGNFFNYVPKFFNPSKVLYNFEKKPTGTSVWTATAIVREVYSTVLNPNNKSKEMPIKDAIVIVGDKEYRTNENGIVAITDPMFQEGNYYLARIIHKGYEFFTYLVPGSTIKHVFDTSDIMRPFDFKASFEGEDLKLDAYNTLVPVRKGITKFSFRIDHGKEGIAANDAYIRIYATNEAGYKTGNPVYEERTGKPLAGTFTHSIDLLNQGIKPGYRMVIAPLHVDKDGKIEKEYPEVDVGLTFSMELSLISALASFDTPLQPAVEFLGNVNNAFDLGLDVEMNDIMKPGKRVDENGVVYNTKIISFGFNKDFEKEFGDQAEDDKDKKDDKKTTDKLKDKIESSGNRIIINVHDNGVGIDPIRIAELQRKFASPNIQEDMHIGLCNVNMRIRLICGESYGLSLQSTLGKGTNVIITLPIIEL
jgi:hypothetical protein